MRYVHNLCKPYHRIVLVAWRKWSVSTQQPHKMAAVLARALAS
jgi:hypothetical protein